MGHFFAAWLGVVAGQHGFPLSRECPGVGGVAWRVGRGLLCSLYTLLCLLFAGSCVLAESAWIPASRNEVWGSGLRLIAVFCSLYTLPVTFAGFAFVGQGQSWIPPSRNDGVGGGWVRFWGALTYCSLHSLAKAGIHYLYPLKRIRLSGATRVASSVHPFALVGE